MPELPLSLSEIDQKNTPTPMLDWDDLRYVLAIARAGSLTGAARFLSVTHSTVLRRIDAIEERIKVRLFERRRTGYIPTEAGEYLRQSAERCEPIVAQAERQIIGGDTSLTGIIRVASAHALTHYLLPPALAKFHSLYPKIVVHTRTSFENVDLSRGEADVSVRMSTQVLDSLVGRQIGAVKIRVYGYHAAPYLSQVPTNTLLSIETLARDFPWIGFDFKDRIYEKWMEANIPSSAVVARSDFFPSVLSLVRTGLGIALMPEFIAAEVPGLIALSERIEDFEPSIWILTHADLRNTARIRAFMQTVGDAMKQALPK